MLAWKVQKISWEWTINYVEDKFFYLNLDKNVWILGTGHFLKHWTMSVLSVYYDLLACKSLEKHIAWLQVWSLKSCQWYPISLQSFREIHWADHKKQRCQDLDQILLKLHHLCSMKVFLQKFTGSNLLLLWSTITLKNF